MNAQLVPIVVLVGAALVLIVGFNVMMLRAYRRVAQGRALIVNKMGNQPHVSFTGLLVYPFLHTAEELDITLKTVTVEASGREALKSRDGLTVDARILFYVKVRPTAEGVLAVARSLGVAAAGDPKRIQELFGPKFLEATKVVVRQLDAAELTDREMEIKDRILQVIGTDLSGFDLDDAVIERLEARPANSPGLPGESRSNFTRPT